MLDDVLQFAELNSITAVLTLIMFNEYKELRLVPITGAPKFGGN